MPKKYAFTRTMFVNTVTAMACDTETAEIFNFSFKLSGPIPVEKRLKKIAQEHAPNNAVVVSIVNTSTTKQCRGITEEQFIADSVLLDPVTRRPIAE